MGRLLADRLARGARCLSVDRLRAHVVASNDAAVAVVKRLGLVVSSAFEDGSHALVVETEAGPPSR